MHFLSGILHVKCLSHPSLLAGAHVSIIMLLVFLLLATALAFDCSVKELEPYDFNSIKRVYTSEISKNTPPSTSTHAWHFGICENTDSIDNCPKNSDICGITTLHFNNKEKPIVSEIIGFNAGLAKEYVPFDDDKGNGITITFKGASWGDVLVDAHVKFICDKSEGDLKIDKWNGEVLNASLKTPAACASSSKKPTKKPKAPVDTGELWGWFTWIFIFLVLFLSIYIIGGAWFQYNKGNAIDFSSALKEVLENFVDLLKGLPGFVREIVEKFTGNLNRGEYSAV